MGFPSARLDVAFVVDTTGSMKDDIRAVKDSLFDIVDTIVSRTKNLIIRFAIVSYRASIAGFPDSAGELPLWIALRVGGFLASLGLLLNLKSSGE